MSEPNPRKPWESLSPTCPIEPSYLLTLLAGHVVMLNPAQRFCLFHFFLRWSSDGKAYMTSCDLWPFPQNLGRKVYTGSTSCLRLHSPRSQYWDKRHLGEMALSSALRNSAAGNRAGRWGRSREWWRWERLRVPLWASLIWSVPLDASGNRTSYRAIPQRGQKDGHFIYHLSSEIGCGSLLGIFTTTMPAYIPPCPNQLYSSD